MDSMVIARKTFRQEDQEAFAALSGDYNPIHMDAVFARRTQAGRPVVHGVHCLLWALDSFFCTQSERKPISRIQCKFSKLTYPGEQVTLHLASQTDSGYMLQARVGSAVTTAIVLTIGSPRNLPELLVEDGAPVREGAPVSRDFLGASKCSGSLECSRSFAIENRFPWACEAIGQIRTAGLARMSQWVGMVNPGLHSIFTALDVSFTVSEAPSLRFRVARADERYRHLRQEVYGCGFSGTVDSLVRRPPVQQVSMQDVKKVVVAGEFASVTALVVGVSRGLGEVTAKLIAAGGGRVIGTYAVGQTEADRVAAEIRSCGGSCSVLPLRLQPATSQGWPKLPESVNCLFYFATPPVVPSSNIEFDKALFDSYIDIYATGFATVCSEVASGSGPGVCAFYPSTVYVEDDRPSDLTEYAMAKAAGEILCSELPRKLPRLTTISRRIPRVLTDLSASAFTSDYGDPLQVMLPIVRDVAAAIG